MPGSNSVEKIDPRLILGIMAMGITSIVTQVVLFREFLSIFSGNELVIGIMLASWLVLTAIGSFGARVAARWTLREVHLIALLLCLAILPLATAFVIRYARNVVFPVGMMLSLGEVLVFSFVLLMLYCVLSGAFFTLWVQALRFKSSRQLPTSVYGWEAIGSLIGGVLFNCILIFILPALRMLCLLAAVDLVIAFLLALRYGGVPMRSAIGVLGLVVVGLSLADTDGMTRKYLYPNQTILTSDDTPYGNVVVASQSGQLNFYQNGVLLFSTNDVTTNEENVHYAMVQRQDAKRVLVVSGDLSGTVREIAKYPVERIDYVELDPRVLDVEKTFAGPLPSVNVHLVAEDARRYLRKSDASYDVVLVNLPDPSTAQINRYYTVDFFRELKQRLTRDAVVSLSTVSSADYLSGEARVAKSILYNSLRAEFDSVLVIPGMRDYFLASDRDLDIHIARLTDSANIATVYVNRYYLDDQILRQRSEDIRGTLDSRATVNRDFKPVAYHRYLLLWLSQFGANLWMPIVGIVALILILAAVRLNPLSIGVFTGGVAASATEVLVLISFQILYGYAYLVIGLVVTLFMAGLATGSLWGLRRARRVTMRQFVVIQCGVALGVALLPGIILARRSVEGGEVLAQWGLLLLTFVLAVLVGREFFVASQLREGKPATIASELYSIDLLGSAIGALIVSVYLLPALGVVPAAFLVSALCIVSSVIGAISAGRTARQQARLE